MTSVATNTDRYHHGDLPNALRSAAVELIDERGVSGFSLREVARRAGVSHTAPAHHFGDVRGLLTSVAVEGFEALAATTGAAAAAHDDPIERLRAIGEAYVTLARSHPGHCAVMFRPDVVHDDDEALHQRGMAAFAVLVDTVTAVVDHLGSPIPVDDAVLMCWSTMQGLVVLQPKFDVIAHDCGTEAPSSADLVDRFTDIIVRGLRP